MSIRSILEDVVTGRISIDEAEKKLRFLALELVNNSVKLDIGREARRGIPEVIYAEGKTIDDLIKITRRVLENHGRVIISRVNNEQAKVLEELFNAEYAFNFYERARMIVIKENSFRVEKTGRIGVLAAGTADIPIAEEARITAEEMGCEVIYEYDVGIAGIHRLFPALKKMIEADVSCIVVVAGMEGALPSVVASLTDVPVIGVPRSVGYGFGAGGIGALTTMLQSCVLGLLVVNIDNGVNAGASAALIARKAKRINKLA
ncbi:MAG: nickel pincer cofactor biosynthesis protein LarB [Candidatus Methanomethylicia archaeon]